MVCLKNMEQSRKPFIAHYTYPTAKCGEDESDFFGTKISDPYRWLEDGNSAATAAFVGAQNELTNTFLNNSPVREQIRKRLTELWDYPKFSLPAIAGGRYFFTKNDGLQNQASLYWQEDLNGQPRLLLDPNTLSDDGTIALTLIKVSPDGKFLAYALSHSGSDWQSIRIREVETGIDLEEELHWCKFSGIAWRPDSSGFCYNRFPQPEHTPPGTQYQHNKLYLHNLGAPQSADRLIYDRSDQPDWILHPLDLDAPTGWVAAIDLNQPEREHWRQILPATDEPLSFVINANGNLAVGYQQDACHHLSLYDLDGVFIRKVELPALGSIVGLFGAADEAEMFLSFSSYLFPTATYRYDFASSQLQPMHIPELDFDVMGYETKQFFFRSKDGAEIPLFITHKKGLKLDGKNPTILYGYGGFKISLLPQFYVNRTIWLEAGGVFAVANLQGGDEYGEAWHAAGMLGKKQNVFDDFIGAAEWLVEKNYCSPQKLAIIGGSNGGLLVAACMMQRPDLFGAVHCAVPVIDMLRYHLFTIGKYWVGEYGNAEADEEQFKWLYAYSPLHNIKKAKAIRRPSLPPLNLTTGLTRRTH